MHIDGEARTKGGIRGDQRILGPSRINENKVYLFLYGTAVPGPSLRKVITHYQQRRRAEITGHDCEAGRPGLLMKLHNTNPCKSQREYCGRLKLQQWRLPKHTLIILRMYLSAQLPVGRIIAVLRLVQHRCLKTFFNFYKYKCRLKNSSFRFCQTKSYFFSSPPCCHVSNLTAFQLHSRENTFIVPFAGIQPWCAPHCL